MRFSTLLAAMVVLACVVSSCSSGGGNAGAADDVTIRLPDIQADGTGSSNDLLSDVHRLPPDGGGEAVDGGGDGETAWPPPDVTEDDGASTDLSDATDLPDDVPDTTPLPDAGPDTPWLPDIIPDTAIPQDLPVEEVAEEIAEEDVAPGCGDGECSPAEDCATCPGDCPCPGGYSCVLGSCQYAGICPNVPAPEPLDLDPLPAMVPAGKVEKTTANGFTDDYLYDGTDLLKIGTRREWGSTVIFFGMGGGSPGMNTTNVIDAHDTGREVQVAFYDPDRILQGCAHNATCQTQPGSSCPGSITYLGWNPVQGGNECNIGSGTEWVDAQPGLLEAGVQPKFWNPDWQLADCSNGGCSDPAKKNLVSDVFYTQRLRFVSTHVVEMKMTVENLSDIDHAPTHQEFPTLYATYGYQNTPNLKVLLDSQGNTIPIDIPANDGFFHKIFDSPGGWAALQNTNLDYGVGLYYENRITGFQGWQKAGVFNNFRSLFSFGIPGKGTVNARAYIVLGSYETIAGLIADLDGSLPPFGVLDSPAADAPVDGTVNVSGWVLDNKGVSKLTLLVEPGQKTVTMPSVKNRFS